MGRRLQTTVLTVVAMLGIAGQAQAASSMKIETLSNRADLVSGGDVLVAVRVPPGVRTSKVKVTVGTRNVTSAFRSDGPRRIVGLITGLRVGQSTLHARAGSRGAQLPITNHPIGGPVFSGPQPQPWPCQRTAVDKQCNQAAKYSYMYLPKGAKAAFKRYDPKRPARDIATTKTQGGRTVPFVVRVEEGYLNRDMYRVAVLIDPRRPWTARSPQRSWNGKVVVKQGQGCGAHHGVAETSGFGAIPDVIDQQQLGLGFAVITTALVNSTQSCNVAVQSESVMMLKERFVERYGPIRYAIAEGCSGGSLSQMQDQNAYPGLYQGLLPSCTFPDPWTPAMDGMDCPLTERYFAAAGLYWSPEQRLAVQGKRNPAICDFWTTKTRFAQSLEPGRAGDALNLQNCGSALRDDEIWSPSNPRGVRCTLQDTAVNIFGKRAEDGYAQRPLGNVGVQYGLRAVLSGTISPAQFVDLNQQVGSYDINLAWQPQRVAPDRGAVDAAYRSGAVNEATHLGDVAIIDQAGADVDIHERYRSFAIRARMNAALGGHANQVIWYGIQPKFPDPLLRMDAWLSAVERDRSNRPLKQKIASNRPANVHDICNINGVDNAGGDDACRQNAGPGTSSREAAGGPATADVIDCQLKPLTRTDYGQVQFTDQQWATLQQIFPAGVCDFTKPGNGQRPTVAWQTYKAGAGGRPLGPAPTSKPLRG